MTSPFPSRHLPFRTSEFVVSIMEFTLVGVFLWVSTSLRFLLTNPRPASWRKKLSSGSVNLRKILAKIIVENFNKRGRTCGNYFIFEGSIMNVYRVIIANMLHKRFGACSISLECWKCENMETRSGSGKQDFYFE